MKMKNNNIGVKIFSVSTVLFLISILWIALLIRGEMKMLQVNLKSIEQIQVSNVETNMLNAETNKLILIELSKER